jgi:ribose transport system substrate-binding protein
MVCNCYGKFSLSCIKLFCLLLCFILFPSVSVPAADQFSVAYIGFSTDKPFWFALGNAIKKEAESNRMTLLDLTPPEPNALAQAKFIEHAINRKVDALIIGADTPTALSGALDSALKEKIPVVAIDTEIEHPAVVAFVGTDNQKGAKMAGEYIAKQANGKGRVLIVGGAPGHPNGEIRKNGVAEAVKKAGMSVISRYADWKDEKAYLITRDEFGKENDITAVFACWDPGIETVGHVLEQMELKKMPILVGFDGLPRTMGYIEEGRVTATVAQNIDLMAQRSVVLVLNVLLNEEYEIEELIEPYIIDKQLLGGQKNSAQTDQDGLKGQ